MTPACPHDNTLLTALDAAPLGETLFYHYCGTCRGLLLPLGLVPELAPWLPEIRRAVTEWPRSKLGCPACNRAMHRVVHEGVDVEICCHCDLAWLDYMEIGLIRPRPKDQMLKGVKSVH